MKKKYQIPAIIVAVGFLYGGYLFYGVVETTIPQLEQRLAEKDRILAGKNNELRKLRNFSENIESVKLQLRELNLQLEAALESMPRNYDLSGLLRKLSVIGFNSGIELNAFRPGTASNKEGEFYETMQVAFNLNGSFTQMMSFFDQALRLRRIIRIDRVAMRALASSGAAASRNTGVGATAEVNAKLYRFVD